MIGAPQGKFQTAKFGGSRHCGSGYKNTKESSNFIAVSNSS